MRCVAERRRHRDVDGEFFCLLTLGSASDAELEALREALDATEALCERQREELRALKSAGARDADGARREAELASLKASMRAMEAERAQWIAERDGARVDATNREAELLALKGRLREVERDAARAQQVRTEHTDTTQLRADNERLRKALIEAELQQQQQSTDTDAQLVALRAQVSQLLTDKERLSALQHQQQPQQLSSEAEQQLRRDNASLRLQVTSLAEQLTLERDATAEERREEVASLQRAMDRVRVLEAAADEAKARETALQSASDGAASAREREALLKAHLLEREEELETLSNESAALRVEVQHLRAELADARKRLTRLQSAEEELAATSRALQNLDEALGAMTDEHKQELVRRERVVRERLADEWQARVEKLRREWDGELAAAHARADALQLELQREHAAAREWAIKCADINREVEPLREAFAECMRKLTEAVDKDAYAVDKRLVSNLVCSYFTMADSSKRNEVLCLMLRILDVPKVRRDEVYRRTAGWLGGFSEDDASSGGRSISDMWVEFLIKESEQRVAEGRQDDPPNRGGNEQPPPPPPPTSTPSPK